jgi:formylglycine-generating enzyme required for sulfatase activity
MSPRRWFGLVLLSGLLVVPGLALLGWTRAPAPLPRKRAKGFSNSIGMKLVLIPAGKFTMGSPPTEKHRDDDEQQHEVTITKAFYLGVYEVTQGQWRAVMGKDNNPSFFSKTGGGKDSVKGLSEEELDHFPVECVSWKEILTFLEKLNALPAEKKSGVEYRLPTEAQWEYACRGGATSSQPFNLDGKPSASLGSTQANFHGNYPYGGADKGPDLGRTSKVGSYKPNAFGLYDMHGNVWEWCADWYGQDYYGKGPERDPPGPADGSDRVIRGGGWGLDGRYCRAAVRDRRRPSYRDYNRGFRVAAVPRR